MYFAMISRINNTREEKTMLFDGYVEHVISSKVAISEMWSFTSFIISINNENMENLKQMKIRFETLTCSIPLFEI